MSSTCDNRSVQPLFFYAEMDGPDSRTARTAQRSLSIAVHTEIDGRSVKVLTVSLQRDPERGFTVATVSMDGATHTKTFDTRR